MKGLAGGLRGPGVGVGMTAPGGEKMGGPVGGSGGMRGPWGEGLEPVEVSRLLVCVVAVVRVLVCAAEAERGRGGWTD